MNLGGESEHAAMEEPVTMWGRIQITRQIQEEFSAV